jgi:hypothetical protein
MSKNKTNKPIAIRLSDETLERIDCVVTKTNLGDRTAVVKLCLLSFLNHFEKASKTTLPLDWNEILKSNRQPDSKK